MDDGATGALQPSQYTNKRLIGRSVWNSKWKLIIPGKTLLADPNQPWRGRMPGPAIRSPSR